MSRLDRLIPIALLLVACSKTEELPKPTAICAAPCTCDTSTACDGEGTCSCDPECGTCLPSCGSSCTCDLTTACDSNCACDPECNLCLPGNPPGPDGGVPGQDGSVSDGEVPEPMPDGGPNTDGGPADTGPVGESCPTTPILGNTMLRICLPFGAGVAGSGGWGAPAVLSKNGRYVFFVAGNDVPHLVPDDTNDGEGDLIRIDLETGQSTVLSRGPGGAASSNGATDILGVARDGSRVVFSSSSPNLITPDDNGISRDNFVWTEGLGVHIRYSETQFHAQSMMYMGDTVWPRSFRFTNNQNSAVLNWEDSGDDGQIFYFDFTNSQMQLISESAISSGALGDGDSVFSDVSADGRWVAFASDSRNLITGYTGPSLNHMYRFDRNSGAITRISVNVAGLEASDPSRDPSVANNGSVVFTTESDFIVGRESNGETDIVFYDGGASGPRLVTVSEGGGLADGRSEEAQISGDGRFVVFTSYATNLVPSDTNGNGDIFVHDLSNGRTEILTRGADGHSHGAQISEDGRVIMFLSTANNLVPGDAVEFGLEIFVLPNPLLP